MPLANAHAHARVSSLRLRTSAGLAAYVVPTSRSRLRRQLVTYAVRSSSGRGMRPAVNATHTKIGHASSPISRSFSGPISAGYVRVDTRQVILRSGSIRADWGSLSMGSYKQCLPDVGPRAPASGLPRRSGAARWPRASSAEIMTLPEGHGEAMA